jgi:hypothetical protein
VFDIISNLLDRNLLGCRSSRFWNGDGKDTILQTSLDVFLVDASWEIEGAVEVANRAFGDPEAVFMALLANLLAAGSLRHIGGWFVFFIGVRWTLVFTFHMTFDHKSLWVGEFNVDLVLGQARKLTVEVVPVFGFTYIESRGEATHRGLFLARSVDIIVVQKPKERGEVVNTREESHYDLMMFGIVKFVGRMRNKINK